MPEVFILDSDSVIVQKILQSWPAQEFNQDCSVVYPGQVPNVCVLLIDGEAEVIERKKIQTFKSYSLLGFSEMLESLPARAEVKIRAGAKACVFDRVSALQEAELLDALKSFSEAN